MLTQPELRIWYDAALNERWFEPAHDAEIQKHGSIVEDLRTQAE